MDLEHLKAKQQASAYERHLTKLNNAVFPRSMEDSVMGRNSAHAVSRALVDGVDVVLGLEADGVVPRDRRRRERRVRSRVRSRFRA